MQGSKETIVLKDSENYLLTSEFDRSTKRILPSFSLVPKDKEKVDFKYEIVGPLLPSEKETKDVE